jgi:hypothetical protein
VTIYNKGAVAAHLLFGGIFVGFGAAFITAGIITLGQGWGQLVVGAGIGVFLSFIGVVEFLLPIWHIAHHPDCRWYEY